MAANHGHHDRNEMPRSREADVLRKVKHRGDCSLLFDLCQIAKRSGQMPSSACDSSSACPVGTSTSSCAAELRAVEANQQFLDQQSIIEDDVHY
jgi:hypothetical protein